MPTVGELIVNLKADTASFAKDLKKATDLSFGSAKEIERSMKLIGTAAVAGAGVAAAALFELTRRTVDLGAETLALAQKSGVTTEAFSALRFGAEQSHVGVESLTMGLKFLNKDILDTGTGGTKTAKVFQALGVAVKDASGNLLPADQVLADLADKFQAMPDGAEKSALAVKLFGRAGSDMIPFLNQGKAGIEAFRIQAQSLGIVIGRDFAESAHKMQQELQVLEAREKAVGIAIAEYLVPKVIIAIDYWRTWGDESAKASQSLIDNPGIAKLATDAERLAAKSMAAASETKKLATEMAQLQALSKSGAAAAQQKGLDNLVAGLKNEIATLGMSASQLDVYKAKELGASEAVLAHVKALDKMRDSLRAMQTEKIDFPQLTGLDAALKAIDDEMEKRSLGDLEKLGTDMSQIITPGLLANFQAAQVGMTNLSDEMAAQIPQVDQLSRGMERFAVHAVDAFAQAVVSGKGFGEIVRQLVKEIIAMIIKMLIFKTIASFFPGFGKMTGISGFGSPSGGSSTPGLAGGGFAFAGQPVMVGESGPELFIPGSGGVVVPHSALSGAGGGPTVNNYFDFRGTDASAIPRLRQAAKEIEDRAVARSVGTMREMSLRTA